MYFALAGFMQYFRFLKPALALILVFIGLKMILPWLAGLGQPAGQFASWMPERFIDHGRVHLPTEFSLAVIGITLALAIALSVAFPKKK
jgi:predicted tellurium resistance membrane protein TerC